VLCSLVGWCWCDIVVVEEAEIILLFDMVMKKSYERAGRQEVVLNINVKAVLGGCGTETYTG
jgi:hypothetical protein